MEFWRSLNGMLHVRITSADVVGALTALNNNGIELFQTFSRNDLTVDVLIRRQDHRRLRKILERRGDSIESIKQRGVYWSGKRMLKRPILLGGILTLVILSCIIPSRIWFFKVEGNKTIPDKLILEYASKCGISFGASRREVRSEKMKNALLEALPQLQWAGVNTKGCVATISVREREVGKQPEEVHGVSSIVAACDGLIQSCTVINGNAVCTVGQAVKAGQLLISGYTDCGLSIRACRAEGEVFARTDRTVSVVALSECSLKTSKNKETRKYSLLIGKKRINLYKDSGILESTCDKMVLENRLTLPGGFVLPVTLVTEVWNYNEQSTATVDQDQLEQQLEEFASAYLNSQMIAGKILSAEETVMQEDSIIRLEGKYACHEMIGRVQKEEILKPDGKYD